MKNDKKIMLALVIMMLLSMSYISWSETRQADENIGKNWWVLAFDEPKGANLSFTIANHSNKKFFHWSVLDEKKTILKEDEIIVANGTSVDIKLDGLESNISGKITIDVTSDNGTKNIYKELVQ
jgi:hypothetical protein